MLCHYAECRYAERRYAECRGASLEYDSSNNGLISNHFLPYIGQKMRRRRNDVKRRQTTLYDRQKKAFLWSRAK